jgi:hypothetical protein
MDNPEKLGTYGTTRRRKKTKQKHNIIQYVLDTTLHNKHK